MVGPQPPEKPKRWDEQLRERPVVVGLVVSIAVLGALTVVKTFVTDTFPWLADGAVAAWDWLGTVPWQVWLATGSWAGTFVLLTLLTKWRQANDRIAEAERQLAEANLYVQESKRRLAALDAHLAAEGDAPVPEGKVRVVAHDQVVE